MVNIINQKGEEEEESGIIIKKVHDNDVDIVVFSFFFFASTVLKSDWSFLDLDDYFSYCDFKV